MKINGRKAIECKVGNTDVKKIYINGLKVWAKPRTWTLFCLATEDDFVITEESGEHTFLTNE